MLVRIACADMHVRIIFQNQCADMLVRICLCGYACADMHVRIDFQNQCASKKKIMLYF